MTPTSGVKDHHLETRRNTLIAILLTCVAYAFFNIGDAATKMLASKFHFSQIIVTNCLVIIACMWGHGFITQGKKAFHMINPKLIFIRAALSVAIAILNIYALSHVPLTTFYTLVFTSPFWVALMSSMFLGEKMEGRRLGVILAGFGVILFIFRPGGGLFDIYALMVLASAFIYSISMVVMRKMGPHESRTMIISSGSILSILVTVWFLPSHYLTPTPYEWGLFVMMGVLGAIGVSCIAYAFQNAPSASAIAPYHYTQIVWGALLGYFLFNEVPNTQTMIGAAVIIAAGLYLIYGETRTKKQKESVAKAEIGQVD